MKLLPHHHLIFSPQLATLFMAAAVALALLTICFLIFVIFMKSTRVFHICGWLQIISGKEIYRQMDGQIDRRTDHSYDEMYMN